MDYEDYKAGFTATNFWFRTKYKLLDQLLNRLKKKDLKILDLGVGTGSHLPILNKYGDVYAIDINKKALSLVSDKLCKEKKICDACNITYPDNFFDVVISLDLFEHISNDNLAVQETYRVLKKKGVLIFNVPAFSILFSSHDLALNHKRRYSKRRIRKLMKPLKMINLDYWNSFLFFPLLIKVLLNKNKSREKLHRLEFPKIIDDFMYTLNLLELLLIKKKISLPFGTSLFGLYKKD